MRRIKSPKSKFVFLCLIISLAVFMLSGCGANSQTSGTPEPSPTPVSTPEPSSTPVSTPEPSPETGGSAGKKPKGPVYEPTGYSLAEAYSDYFLLGTIYTPNTLIDPEKSLVLDQFNCITPENIMKPDNMQPGEGLFSFALPDAMLKFAEENNLKVVGHTLVWHQQSGRFLGQTSDREKAIEQLRNHITTVVSNYKGRIMSWDVVNEAVNDGTPLPADGDWTKCLRNTQWLRSIGPDYIEMAFRFAHEADPDAILYYNDYNLNDDIKATVVHAMVKDLLEKGVPIHGIGMQGHYSTDVSIASVENSIKLFSELGVEVSITELDVTVNDASVAKSLTREQEVRQAIVYAELFKLFKQYKDNIVRVTFWGTIDTKSWRNDKYPCLFKGDYTPKEAYYAVLDPEKYLADHRMSQEKIVKKTQAMYGTPSIDGEKEELWDKCPEIQVNNSIMAWEGAKGVVRVLWDENYIYCFFEVEDSVLNKDSSNPYEHDSIEVFLDQNNGKTSFYEDDDGHYRVNFEGYETFGNIPEKEGFKSAAKVTPNGYLVELAIPLVNPASEGMVMGFDAQINHSDDTGTRVSITKFCDLTDNTWQTLESIADLELVK
jgi:endo-1,4-beta-xylanase